MELDKLFTEFVREKRYLLNVTPKSVEWYQNSFSAFKKCHQGLLLSDLSKASLGQTVCAMREKNISPVSVNVYMRAMNSFFSWLKENGYTPDKFHVKPLKIERKEIPTFTHTQLKKLLTWKPKTWAEKRLHTIILLLMDCGIRIDESLTLERNRVDLENMLVTVKGKGNKVRTIPVSFDLRKILFLWSKTHDFPLFFPTRNGGKLGYRNTLDDFKQVCDDLKITGVRCSFHTLRHTFALNFIRSGGNVFALQRIMGHDSLKMTQRYVNLQAEDLAEAHIRTSLLAKLR